MLTQNQQGIIFMLLSVICFSTMDILVKFLSASYPTFQLVLFRGVFGLIPIFFIIPKDRLKDFYNTERPLLHFNRCLFGLIALLSIFTALRNLPLATVVSISFAAPIFTTIFSIFFLGEKVGFRRWCAVIVGFLGVLVVVNPQNFQFNYLLVLPILAAIFLTIRDIATKSLATKSNSVEITFVTALLITGFAGLGSIIFGYQVSSEDVNYILASSIFVLFGYLFSVLTVFYAPLSLTASARYSVIIFGMIFGYLILGETPTYNMIIGAIIITLSGLFVIKREKEIGKIK